MEGASSLGCVVQAVLLASLAAGHAPSTLRGILSAAQCAATLGLVPFTVPAAWWRLSPAAARLGLHLETPRTWFPVEALADMSRSARTTLDFICLGIAILSLALGLRIGEAACLSASDCWIPPDPASGHIRIRPEKATPGSGYAFRTPPPYVLAWAAFLCRAAGDLPFADRRSLSTTLTRLQAGTAADGMSFHSLRRGAARYLSSIGHPIQAIEHWCRWKSHDMARFYIGGNSSLPDSSLQLPWPPEGTAAQWTCHVTAGSLHFLFQPPQNGTPVSPKARTGKRRRRGNA